MNVLKICSSSWSLAKVTSIEFGGKNLFQSVTRLLAITPCLIQPDVIGPYITDPSPS